MNRTRTDIFLPDYLVSPGEVLEEYLESLGMTQLELADRTGMAKKTINEIVNGKSAITADTALKLERVLGRPAHFWSNLERQYQEDRCRLTQKEQLSSQLEWLQKVPVKAMTALKWISKRNDDVSQLEEVLSYFGVVSSEQWSTIWKGYQVAYRQSQAFESCAEAVSAWLRKGEIEAQTIQCRSFDKKAFQEALDNIRALTREDPRAFQPRLVEMCADAGVAVVFVPELPKACVSGATRWIGEKAVIQLSLRYKSNDQLWFTFFHEAGHIIKHGRKEVFIEGNGMKDEKENEANVFACQKLIPTPALSDFLRTWDRRNYSSIADFADKIGIAPGIVVGRLQHDRIIPMTHGNKLKIYYRWAKP